MLSPRSLKEMERISPPALCSLVRDWGRIEPLAAFSALMESGVLGAKPGDVEQRIALLGAFMRLRRQIGLDADPQALRVSQKAILGLVPMCNPMQKSELLMQCVQSHCVADVVVCLKAGVDPLAPSTSTLNFAVCGAKARRMEFSRACPYAAMLEGFGSKQWLAIEQAHPAIGDPLGRIPLVAIGGRNGLPSDAKPVDLVSFCFALDMGTPAPHEKFRRERLNRVLQRLAGGKKGARIATDKAVQFQEILEGLAASYRPKPASSDERDRCLMLSQVMMVSGLEAGRWVRSLFERPDDRPAAASELLHDLARCGSSNLPDASDRSLVVTSIRRLVDLGFAADLAAPGTKLTPLMEAASCGHLENMAALIDMGANVDAKDAKGHTARHLAKRAGMADAVAFLDAHQSRLAIHAALPTLALPFF